MYIPSGNRNKLQNFRAGPGLPEIAGATAPAIPGDPIKFYMLFRVVCSELWEWQWEWHYENGKKREGSASRKRKGPASRALPPDQASLRSMRAGLERSHLAWQATLQLAPKTDSRSAPLLLPLLPPLPLPLALTRPQLAAMREARAMSVL